MKQQQKQTNKKPTTTTDTAGRNTVKSFTKPVKKAQSFA